jgi:hypothetical protein
MPQRHPSIEIGPYRLKVGAQGGTRLTARDDGEVPAALSSALRAPPRRRDPPASDDEPATVLEREAEAVELFTALADGSMFANGEVLPRIGQVLDMLERLDRAGRHEETLRLARTISGPLLLLQRWAELLNALGTARRAADTSRDLSGLAWAQHELGTLQLAAGDDAGAEAQLAHAQTLRERLGERQELAATQQNLGVLCRRLREQLHEEAEGPVVRAPGRGLLALILAAVLPLVLAAAAYAVLVPPASRASRLTVKVSGHGLVTSKLDGTQCRHTCTRDLRKGDALSLTARADKGWRFSGWSGGCHGKTPCAPATNASTTVTATFVHKARKLPECRDHKDNDHDRLIDRRDPGCNDGTEQPRAPLPECRDQKDNDHDGLTDRRDPGCNEAPNSHAAISRRPNAATGRTTTPTG